MKLALTFVLLLVHQSAAIRLNNLNKEKTNEPVIAENEIDDLFWEPSNAKGQPSNAKGVNFAKTTWTDGTKAFPEALRGRRLILIGDSNDRNFFSAMSKVWNRKVDSTVTGQDLKKINVSATETLQFPEATCPQETYFQKHDLIVDYVWHPGAMTIGDQPSWHKSKLQDSVYISKHHLPKYKNGTTEVSATKLVGAVLEQLSQRVEKGCEIEGAQCKKRPIVVMMQSSMWDSKLADGARKSKTHKAAAEAFKEWQWLPRASELVKTVQNKVKAEKIFWRTNSNCPNAKAVKKEAGATWVDSITEQQAEEVRNAMRQHDEPWANVGLIDWRQSYVAQHCVGFTKNTAVHYEQAGYDNLFDQLQIALQKYK